MFEKHFSIDCENFYVIFDNGRNSAMVIDESEILRYIIGHI